MTEPHIQAVRASHQCVNDDEEIDMTTHELRMLEPFSDYYSESEYRFIEMEGRVVLDVDSMEPWENYTHKVKEEL